MRPSVARTRTRHGRGRTASSFAGTSIPPSLHTIAGFRPAARAAGLAALALALLLAAAPPAPAAAQAGDPVYDPALFEGLKWRMVGPYRGGRADAVSGVVGDPTVYYMGTTGGGIWKTDDAGQSWSNISDGQIAVASMGSVEVAPSDPSVIYAGTGSGDIRGNTSTGRGFYRSTDGGDSWTLTGLEETGQIGRIAVHPRDPELLYVAALGHPFGKNPERGIYRSRDGGDSWEHVLFVSDSTGASDIVLNPKNPRELYAGLWRGERKPWTMISGGAEGGVYKSTDAGDTWQKLAGGLPEGVVGKVGVAVSPANPDRVWAIIEAEPDGGVYRSDDRGGTWRRVNSENKLRQRAWYYTHVRADPGDEHTVWALNTRLYRSVDGGETFEVVQVPHGDVHGLWINPDDPRYMVVANDGGAQVSVNGGRGWSTYYNQPTAELYDVVVDNRFPYRLYGAQQDNTTISVPAWMSSNTLYPKEHWRNVGGCETGPVALHPDYPDIVYAGCYGGVMDRYDLSRDQVRNVMLYPQLQLGEAGRNLRYRFQWVSPMAVSPHDPDVVYHASQYVHRTTDGGMSWQTISPDLTTNDPAHQDYAGGPINADVTGVEIYNVVFSLAVSPHSPDVIWAGTDDGRVHVTRDGGGNWTDVTPSGLPELATVDEIEVSPHRPGRALIAAHRYRLDDFAPYIFVTDDYGSSWRRRTDGRNGIPADHPTRTVREDPERPGLLYAGTEFGAFVSFDDGGRWQPLRTHATAGGTPDGRAEGALPVTPVSGMKVAHDDLIISTQGRSFWILDDVTPLRQISAQVAEADAWLYQPRDAVRANMGGEGADIGPRGIVPDGYPGGALLHYHLAAESEAPVRLEVVDEAGRVVRTWWGVAGSGSGSGSGSGDEAMDGDTIPAEPGMHRVVWDLTYPGPDFAEDVVIWGYTGGVKAPPGRYAARLTVDGEMQERAFRVLKDPRLDDVDQAEFEEQFRVAMTVRDTLQQVVDATDALRSVRTQAESVAERAEEMDRGERVRPLADSLRSKAADVVEALMQTRNQSNQDPIRFPPRLDNQYVELYKYVTGPDGYISGGPEGAPTAGAYERLEDLDALWADLRARVREVLDVDVPEFNAAVERAGVPAVVVPERPAESVS